MKVQGFTNIENRIEGTITEAELVALVARHIALPEGAELRFYAAGPIYGPADGIRIGDGPDATPLTFAATWRQVIMGKESTLPAPEVVKRAAEAPTGAVVDVMFDPPLP